MGEGRGEGVFSQVVHFEAALDPLFQKAGSLFVKAGLPFTTAGLLSEKAGSPSATAGQLFAKASLPLPKTDQELATARSPATKAGRPFQKEDPPFITAVSLFVKVGPPLVTAGPLLWTAGRISVMSLLTELDSFVDNDSTNMPALRAWKRDGGTSFISLKSSFYGFLSLNGCK